MRSAVAILGLLLLLAGGCGAGPDAELQRLGQVCVESEMLRQHWKHTTNSEEYRALVFKQLFDDVRPSFYTASILRDPADVGQTFGAGQADALDPFEQDLFKRFRGVKQVRVGAVEFATRKGDGGEHQYYQAVRAGKDCVACHRNLVPRISFQADQEPVAAELRQGQLMAIVKVTVSAAK
jgi:hypothetical protein